MSFKVSGARALRLRSGRVRAAWARRGLQALLPESGLSLVMSHGYDAQYVEVIQIDDRKREAMKHEPSSSVQILGPTLRRLRDFADHIGNHSTKLSRYSWTAAAVPSDRVPEIFPRFGMKTELITSHQGTL